MNTITIPKKLIQNDYIVMIPRKRYEQLIKIVKETENDWLYEEPFKSELLRRIKNAQKQKNIKKYIEWKRK